MPTHMQSGPESQKLGGLLGDWNSEGASIDSPFGPAETQSLTIANGFGTLCGGPALGWDEELERRRSRTPGAYLRPHGIKDTFRTGSTTTGAPASSEYQFRITN